MGWPRGLPSTRKQWVMRTHAAVPAGNWQGKDQGIVGLDNGDIYMFGGMVWSVRRGEENPFMQIYRVSPEGNERISVEGTKYLGVKNWDFNNYLPQDAPEYDNGFDVRKVPWNSFTSGGSHAFATDGTFIYFYDGYYAQIFKFDPSTYRADWIAGKQYVWPNNVNSSDDYQGKLATVGQTVNSAYGMNLPGFTHHNGYIYWAESAAGITGVPNYYFRRMKLEPPYPVNTVWSFKNPSGMPTSSWNDFYTWAESINQSTGLPNFCNPDVLAVEPSVAFYDNYLYFQGQFSRGGEFSRIDLDTGLKEVLYYARQASDPSTNPRYPRDLFSNHECCPLGTTHPSFLNYVDHVPGVGTYYYEGFSSPFDRNAEVVNGQFITSNYNSGMFWSGYNIVGETIVKYDIDATLARVQSDGPIRHDRRNPWYDTIANGTVGDESYVRHNYAKRPRMWLSRDGYNPLLTHCLPGHPYTTSAAYPNTLFVMTNAAPGTVIGDTGGGPTTQNLFMVKALQSAEDSRFQVRVKFNGMAMKGYSRHGDVRREAQDLVELA